MCDRRTIFSPCRRYRYTLWREWASTSLLPCPRGNQYLMVIGLNPSTADETQDDPTIRKCIGFAKRWGFGALCMTNLFAWRDTKPEAMKAQEQPNGFLNDDHLFAIAKDAGMILAAWGRHGSHKSRDKDVLCLLESFKLQALKLNGDGSPMHPLYVPYEVTPTACFGSIFTAKEQRCEGWLP